MLARGPARSLTSASARRFAHRPSGGIQSRETRELCRLLNTRGGRRRATAEELQEVCDSVIRGADLFDELWNQRTEEERAALRRLAASSEPAAPDAAALGLVREGYVERRGEGVAIAVPLFREWIADTQGVG